MAIKKVFFAAGGTGGHVFPAIAVADAMRLQDPDLEIVFVGGDRGNEEAWATRAGYRFLLLKVDFLKGASFFKKIKNVASLPGVAKRARALLRDEAPDLVIGSGGYVSGPLVLVASRMKIPTAIMEQNAIPGLTNRLLSRFVDVIFTSFDKTEPLPQKKVVQLGNPVRASAFVSADKEKQIVRQDDRLRILVFGGSQGARRLNLDVPVALTALEPNERKRIDVWHQSGKDKFGETQAAYREAGIEGKLCEFIDDMGEAYAWADLIVCRAGATSLAEIKAAGKASVLVPFPYAAHNHQEKNADAMVAIAASWKLLDADVATGLGPILRQCLEHPDVIKAYAAAALKDAKPNAASDIASALRAKI